MPPLIVANMLCRSTMRERGLEPLSLAAPDPKSRTAYRLFVSTEGKQPRKGLGELAGIGLKRMRDVTDSHTSLFFGGGK